MSGGYQYNLTTQSQFEQMKQKNQQLIQQNYNLKKTLQQLIKVNNQLSQTIQQFNNSALATSGTFKNTMQNQNNKNSSHQQCSKMIEQLGQQVQYFKNIAFEKMGSQQNSDIVNALQGLIQSFKQTQKYYEDQLNGICEQVDNLKAEWQGKIFKIQETYHQKTLILDQIIKQIKKKQQIVSIIEKKINEQKSPRRIIKKNSEIDTSSQRKFSHYNNNQRQAITESNKKQKQISNVQIQDLRQREKKLNEQLKEKDKTISVYTELLTKMRKKLSEKY